MADEDPAEFAAEPFKIRSLDALLDILREVNERAKCPICGKNRGWIRPQGNERIVLPLSEGGSVAVIPILCDYCGYLRLHAAKATRDET